MEIESGARTLLVLIAIGVAAVILTGVSYTNYSNNKGQIQNAVTCTGAVGSPCSTNPSNVNYANAVNVGIVANYTTNAGNIANTSGTNANYAYYILFAALIIAVVMGVLIAATREKS